MKMLFHNILNFIKKENFFHNLFLSKIKSKKPFFSMINKMPYQKVTYLEDLPDIEEVDNAQSPHALSPDQTRLSKRFIRNTQTNLHEMSGMSRNNTPVYVENIQAGPPPQSFSSPPEQMIMNPQYVPPNNQVIEVPAQLPITFSCQDIYHHINSCPLCKQFYKQDNTIYLVIIAILVVFCALLLKKVLG